MSENQASSTYRNKIFELKGINHLALTCADMARTVDFYCNTLGMPLVYTIDFKWNGKIGQHFFFDVGNGDMLAFFYIPDGPEAPERLVVPTPTEQMPLSAPGGVNHLAFSVAPEKIGEYYHKLKERGVEVKEVWQHVNDERIVIYEDPKAENYSPPENCFLSSMYFADPDGVILEFAAWNREVDPRRDALLPPITADQVRAPMPEGHNA